MPSDKQPEIAKPFMRYDFHDDLFLQFQEVKDSPRSPRIQYTLKTHYIRMVGMGTLLLQLLFSLVTSSLSAAFLSTSIDSGDMQVSP